MNKYLIVPLASVPVVAILLFNAHGDRGKTCQTSSTKIGLVSVVSKPQQEDKTPPRRSADGSIIKEPSPTELAQRKLVEERMKRTNAALRLASEKYTPEYCARLADSTMRRRDPELQKLFTSWNLDAQTTRQTLDVLREREIRRHQNRANQLKDAHSLKKAQEKKSADQGEELVAREVLSLQLGESRAGALLDSVFQMEKEENKMAERMMQQSATKR